MSPAGNFDFEADAATERAGLRNQLAMAASLKAEYLRSSAVLGCLRHNLINGFQLLPVEVCLTSTYGPGGCRVFWESQFSRPMTSDRFVDVMAITKDDGEHRLDVRKMALCKALLEAFQMDEAWFRGDTLSLAAARFGHQVQGDAVKVIPRSAAEWLMRSPYWRHLVPPSLVTFLNGTPTMPPSRAVEAEPDPIAARTEHPSASGKDVRKPAARKVIEAAFATWYDTARRTKPQADAWAKENEYSTTIVRELYSARSAGPGRPRKQNNGQQ